MAQLTDKEMELLKGLLEKVNTVEKEPVRDEELEGYRPVIVCNEARGVYYGYAKDTSGDSIKLKNARNVFYWVAPNKGIFGLASDGPGKGSKVGPEADIEVKKVTNVIEVTSKAEKAWTNAKWE